ncbi:MAG: hypothetical protein QM742_03560 [Aquabacterium sp.]
MMNTHPAVSAARTVPNDEGNGTRPPEALLAMSVAIFREKSSSDITPGWQRPRVRTATASARKSHHDHLQDTFNEACRFYT